jgi:hypothetical protein
MRIRWMLRQVGINECCGTLRRTKFWPIGVTEREERLQSWWQLKAPRMALVMANGVVPVYRCEWWVLYHDSGKWRFLERGVRQRCAPVSRADLCGVLLEWGGIASAVVFMDAVCPPDATMPHFDTKTTWISFYTHICPPSCLPRLALKIAVIGNCNSNCLGIDRILSPVTLICQDSHQRLTQRTHNFFPNKSTSTRTTFIHREDIGSIRPGSFGTSTTTRRKTTKEDYQVNKSRH